MLYLSELVKSVGFRVLTTIKFKKTKNIFFFFSKLFFLPKVFSSYWAGRRGNWEQLPSLQIGIWEGSFYCTKKRVGGWEALSPYRAPSHVPEGHAQLCIVKMGTQRAFGYPMVFSPSCGIGALMCLSSTYIVLPLDHHSSPPLHS